MGTFDSIVLFAAIPLTVIALAVAAFDARGKKRLALAIAAGIIVISTTALVLYVLSMRSIQT